MRDETYYKFSSLILFYISNSFLTQIVIKIQLGLLFYIERGFARLFASIADYSRKREQKKTSIETKIRLKHESTKYIKLCAV